jgi:hypothetical protein
MELRSSEEEVESLYGLYKEIKKEVELLGLALPTYPADGPQLDEDRLGDVDVAVDTDDGGPGSIGAASAADRTEETTSPSRRSAQQIQQSMTEFRHRVEILEPLMGRFRKRLGEKDPITEKPRYGAQAQARVERLLSRYTAIAATDVNPSLVEDCVREEAQKANEESAEKRQAEQDALAAKRAIVLEQQAAAAAERVERERQVAAERAAQVEVAQREAREAAAAERAWVRSIPRTLDSVRTQVQRFRQTAGSIVALKTIFSQILSHPEDENCRRIRRDHPKFLADIGNHDGGKEILIAGGFDVGFVDEVPSFICKEPNVETDLDGWTEWYDRIKGTLQIIQEEMS